MATQPINLEAIAKTICGDRGFSFEGRIGDGAFKESFKVEDQSGQQFALKILKPGNDPDRLDREIAAMTRCEHRNIGRLSEIGKIDTSAGQILFFIEIYLSGGTLSDRVKAKGLIAAADAKQLGAQLAEAVVYLGSLELVHRDLKPENILFGSDPLRPVIVDFGLVRNLAETSLTQTWMMHGPGTPLFASPEQLNNQKALIDWRSDQYSLGVTLAMVALGVHPFEQDGDSLPAIVGRVAQRQPQSAKFVTKAAGTGLSVLIKMTKPYPILRYCTPDAFLSAWQK